MKFVNRKKELAFLERRFAGRNAELLVLWGRRRVGKTTLLMHFARNKPVVYHMAVRTTPTDELRRLSGRLGEFFRDPVLNHQFLTSWEAVWVYLAGKKQKFGLVLDEFPYQVEGSPSLPSQLQEAWDTRLRSTGIKLILCGSSVSMMERTLFSPTAPLYGRRTGQWHLRPFGPMELNEMLGGSLLDTIEIYSVVGGVPMYAERFTSGKSLPDNIRRHILTRGAPLYDEVSFLLRQELREPRVYQAILAALASGARKFGELSSKTGLERANLTRYVAQLAELGMVKREIPITEDLPHKSRKGIYRITDPFVQFWYRFVYPHLDRLEMDDADGVLRDEIRPHLHRFTSATCEPVIADLFVRGPLRRLVPFQPAHIGRHWSRTEEFDLVLLDGERSRALVAEIKWTRRPVSPAVMQDLKQRVHASGVFAGKRLTFAAVSRAGFKPLPKPDRSERFVDLSLLET